MPKASKKKISNQPSYVVTHQVGDGIHTVKIYTGVDIGFSIKHDIEALIDEGASANDFSIFEIKTEFRVKATSFVRFTTEAE
jgi:hypothetical protein